jgi:putative addiction module CopG family antidote
MPSIEKVSIALPSYMLAMVKQAVEGGDYASSSEVVREALREWKARRAASGVKTAETPRPARSRSAQERTDRAVGLSLINERRRKLNTLCRRYAVRRLALFGSALREDFDPATSDLDVTVEFGKPRGRSAERQYFDFKTALEELFGRPVDLVELAAMPDSRLKRYIERSQVPVYGKAA